MMTGSGGRDLSGNKRTAPQSFDQELTKTNAALASNCAATFDKKEGADAGDQWKKGKPIRCSCAKTLMTSAHTYGLLILTIRNI